MITNICCSSGSLPSPPAPCISLNPSAPKYSVSVLVMSKVWQKHSVSALSCAGPVHEPTHMCGSTQFAAITRLGEPEEDVTTQMHKHPCAFVSQTPNIRISGSFVALAIHFAHTACGRIGEERRWLVQLTWAGTLTSQQLHTPLIHHFCMRI